MKALISIAAMSVALLSAGAGSAYAGIIYNNGGPNQAGHVYADSGYSVTTAADEFTLTAGSNTITGINWWGTCNGGPSGGTCPSTNAFTLYIYSDSNGSPGTQLDSYSVGGANQAATGKVILFTNDEYSYSASIPNLVLTPGTQYWLGISDASSPFDLWSWETTGTVGTGTLGDGYSYCTVSACGTIGWQADDVDLAFNLTGPSMTSAVPEPGTLALFGTGLAALFLMRRRSKAMALTRPHSFNFSFSKSWGRS